MWAKNLNDCNDPSDYAYCACAQYSCGYSQPKRENISIERLKNGTAEADCSSLVNWCLFMGGFLPENIWFHTAIERDYLSENDFDVLVYEPYLKLERNDVLWRTGHTALYIGEGLQAEALRDENGQAGYEGTIPGDNDNGETIVQPLRANWQYVIRKNKPILKGEIPMTFLFTTDKKDHVYFYDSGNVFLIASGTQQAVIKDAYKKSTGNDIPFFHLDNADRLFMIMKQRM